MSDHIQRKKEEYVQLNEKFVALSGFIFGGAGSKDDNSKFMNLSKETRELLLKQYSGMSVYRDSLVEQLSLLGVTVN